MVRQTGSTNLNQIVTKSNDVKWHHQIIHNHLYVMNIHVYANLKPKKNAKLAEYIILHHISICTKVNWYKFWFEKHTLPDSYYII